MNNFRTIIQFYPNSHQILQFHSRLLQAPKTARKVNDPGVGNPIVSPFQANQSNSSRASEDFPALEIQTMTNEGTIFAWEIGCKQPSKLKQRCARTTLIVDGSVSRFQATGFARWRNANEKRRKLLRITKSNVSHSIDTSLGFILSLSQGETSTNFTQLFSLHPFFLRVRVFLDATTF